MHQITGEKEVVERILEDSIQYLEMIEAKKSGGRALSPLGRKKARSKTKVPEVIEVANALRSGLVAIRGEGRVSTPRLKRKTAMSAGERAPVTGFAPRNQTIALVQSAMDEYLDEKVGSETPPRGIGKSTRSAPRKKSARTVASQRDFYKGDGKAGRPGKTIKSFDLLAQFGDLDPRWIKVVSERAKLLFRKKHAFISHVSVEDFRTSIKNETTIAIVGDWGGGNAAAQRVAVQISKLKPDHIIHLGDVYYAGTPKEVTQRFLKYWPSPDAAGRSFALNSNHEMYSGGYGYFDLTLKKFKQPASYFALANANWRFVGLDTGYIDHDLQEPQTAWLKAQLKGPQKNILLSHHQLFSAYEETDASKLENRVKGLLSNVYGWFWGHEHLALVYTKRKGIKAVCLGNGCFPYAFPKTKPSVGVKWMDQRQLSDPDYPGGHTFALLRLKGPQIEIDFIDHRGEVGFTETWK